MSMLARHVRIILCAFALSALPLHVEAQASPFDDLDDAALPRVVWSRFDASPDTRMIFVSSSTGDDATARPGDPQRPFRTIAAAMRFLGDGRPDWFLLKCGDTFEESWTGAMKWGHSGRSPDEPILIAPYGRGDRPVVDRFETAYGGNDATTFVRNVALYGIRFRDGLDVRTGGSDITIENCFFDTCEVAIQGLAPEPDLMALRNVVIRQSIFNNAYSVSRRVQNLYVSRVDGLTVEGCFFYRGGWRPETPGAEATILNHNAYIQSDTANVIFRNNISVDASSHGVQLRSGGLCEGNLFIGNPINLQVGSRTNDEYPEKSPQAEIRYNVILDSRDIDDQPRGYGLWIENAGPVNAHHNLIAHQRRGSAGNAVVVGLGHQDISIHHNIIHGWTARANPAHTRAFVISGQSSGENVIRDNLVSLPEPSMMLDQRTDRQHWRIDLQRFNGAFEDPERSIETYMRSIDMEPSVHAFIERCLAQRKRAWDARFEARYVIRHILEGFTIRGQAR